MANIVKKNLLFRLSFENNLFTEICLGMRTSCRFALLIFDDMNLFCNFRELLFQVQNINVSRSYQKLPKEIMTGNCGQLTIETFSK